jgi:hypothetical protein
MAVQRRSIQGLPLDPAVETHLGSVTLEHDPVLGVFAKERAAARNQTERQRKKVERDRARVKTKLTIDLPETQKAWIQQHAQAHGVPPAHLVAFLLKHAIPMLERGEIDIEKAKIITRNMRYAWFLKIED